MCGIIGFINNKDAINLTLDGLKKIKDRGKDCYGIAIDDKTIHSKKLNGLDILKETSSDNAIGHCLHSIVNNIAQPIQGKKGILIANCEIYNWKSIDEKYSFNAKNDSEVILKLIEHHGIKDLKKILDQLDGVYAFCYKTKNMIILARDIIGIKPIFYSEKKGFSFASEKKAIPDNFFPIRELNPRTIIRYDIKEKKTREIKRNFFKTSPPIEEPIEKITYKLTGLITDAIAKRIPDQKFGILFSGGIDSTYIALICKMLGVDFTCYTAALSDPEKEIPQDLIYAKKIAEDLGFELKIKTLSLDDIPKRLKKIIPLIEDTNVVKTGVGLTFYAALELAKKDGIRVIFSGLGSEEIFAGYKRHKDSTDINKECTSGLLKMYERDLYRDDCITMNNNIELRVPFLDKKLVEYALKINPKHKITQGIEKYILRRSAKSLGMPDYISDRKKKAAQYGSNFDKALQKLTKKSGQKYKSEYLKQFLPKKNLRLGILFSSGKDSNYAAYVMQKQNYDISCLITIESTNPDSYMYHTPNISLARLQAQAMDIPIIIKTTAGEKEKELEDLKKALIQAIKEYNIEGIVTGALYSTYQRDRIEKIADSLGLKIFSPLWHKNQENYMKELIDNDFKIILGSIAADGLTKKDLGKIIDTNFITNLIRLNEKVGMNIAFEGGEAESFVLDSPMFKKKIIIDKAKTMMENECTGRYTIEKAHLEKK